MEFLDSSDGFMRSECEELLLTHFDLGHDLIEQEIRYRQTRGESEESLEPVIHGAKFSWHLIPCHGTEYGSAIPSVNHDLYLPAERQASCWGLPTTRLMSFNIRRASSANS